jgi:lysophospholipase L1-like esterase
MMKNRNIPIRFAIMFLSLIVLAGCASLPPAKSQRDILVIGDSVMAWNRGLGQEIGDVIAARLSRDVTSRPVPGAQFDNESALASAVGFDIQAQYLEGPWKWVVMNGGANDLGFSDCGCGDCSTQVDRLISADGTGGVIPAFLDRVKRDGASVLWMGYYNSPGTSFKGCADDLEVLETRIKRNLAGKPNGFFLEGENFVNRNDPSHFASDGTHPSPKGSAILGTALADIIVAASQTR